ncbi:MAG: hypothetical protein WCH44_00405 [Betaproteobacteria bacterium]
MRDVLRHGENAHLVNCFDVDALAQMVLAVLRDYAAQTPVRQQALADVQRFNLHTALAGCDAAWIRRALTSSRAVAGHRTMLRSGTAVRL